MLTPAPDYGKRFGKKSGKRKPADRAVRRLLFAFCLFLTYYSLLPYGSASMMRWKRKLPPCTTPKVKFTSMLALFGKPPGIDTVNVEL